MYKETIAKFDRLDIRSIIHESLLRLRPLQYIASGIVHERHRKQKE
jgi:hypothetical protein